jgi:hypothetical protein
MTDYPEHPPYDLPALLDKIEKYERLIAIACSKGRMYEVDELLYYKKPYDDMIGEIIRSGADYNKTQRTR